MEKKIFTIPNILSLVRILLIPVFIWLYFSKISGHYLYALGALILSALTDVVDGLIARRFHMVSELGKMLDPAADKLTQAALVVCVTTTYPYILPLLILFFVKEALMLIGTLMLVKSGTKPTAAMWWGKLSTAMIYILLIVLLIENILQVIPEPVLIVLTVVTGLCIVFSFFNYYPVFRRLLKDSREGK